MAGTTTNGFPYPESTDFVTDGAQAIEDLAVDVDKKMGLYRITSCTASFTSGTAGSVSNGVITIGTGNSAISISNAFSNAFSTYQIVLSIQTASNAGAIQLQFGSAVTNYRYSGYGWRISNASFDTESTSATSGYAGSYSANGGSFTINAYGPNLDKGTQYWGNGVYLDATTGFSIFFGGVEPSTTQHTSFKLSAESGHTWTGGRIAVYGYN